MLFSKREKKSMARGNEGFTFIEIVMALCVFSIGVLGVTLMQATATRSNNSAMRTSTAVAYASDQMEQILGEQFTDLEDGSITDGPYTVSWTIDPEVNNKKQVHVRIDWSNKGAAQVLNFDMIRNVKI